MNFSIIYIYLVWNLFTQMKWSLLYIIRGQRKSINIVLLLPEINIDLIGLKQKEKKIHDLIGLGSFNQIEQLIDCHKEAASSIFLNFLVVIYLEKKILDVVG